MLSDNITVYFPPIKLERPLEYLKSLSSPLSSLIREFSGLSEEEMASFKYPSYVSEVKENILNSREGKESKSFKEYNTVITAINLLKSCAKINVAIYALLNKYRAEENRNHYRLTGVNNDLGTRFNSQVWNSSNEEEVLQLKNSATEARDRIHSYSKKYTVDGFETGFINTIKYSVYDICRRFYVETKTMSDKAEEAGSNCLGLIVSFAILILIFWVLTKIFVKQ